MAQLCLAVHGSSLKPISLAYQTWYIVFSHNKIASAGLSAVKIISRTTFDD
jgi:hypothetical protein